MKLMLFFFSSRRRHTRCLSDWSSDVCSSDLRCPLSTRTLCKHFTSLSPVTSGHRCQTDRAPMLVGTPLPVSLSVFRALGPALRPDVPVEQRRTDPRPPGFLALSCVLATQAREPHLGT